ncbi:MAG: tetratricopeptide repeat protein [Saprospiraceae bacterium]|nr:tetratricopeptide repeat protein [Saprospiraceae bacterium]
MNRFYIKLILALVVATATMACVTKKKRTETSKFGKFYQNTTAYYNGYWNANEILKESLITLRAANVDDYNKILEVEDFIAVDNPKMVKPEMDKIQEKVSTVAQLHEASDWVDDCYVMMGKAQYLKHEYETAEETLEYFQEDFNPSNPYGRNYKSKKPTGKAAKKAREVEKKEKEKEREKVKEEKQEAKEEKAKTKEEERKAKAKAREKEKKEKEKQRKEAAKNRKKGIKTPKTTKEETKTVEPTPTTSTTKKPEEVAVKEEDIYKPITPEKPAEDKTAFSEGMLWLAKTYIKRENWFAAQILLEKLDKGFKSDELKAELPATFANLYIKQERYDEALPYLDEAIEASDVKSLKARYAFIAGQISQKNKNVEAALNYFDISKKYASDPKMEFMSELAVAKNGIASGKRSKESVIEDFKKLLNEDKYVQVKDQIYFTLAEIELSQNNEEAAIGYYKNSLAANVGDQKLKSEAYYRVANLYYDKQKYLFASNYFDSTLTLLPLTDVRQVQVKNM